MMNRENLQKLATGLAYGMVPEGVEFDMRWFTGYIDDEEAAATDCGTVGCALGHAPFFGFEKSSDEDWFKYCERHFGVRPDKTTNEWALFFGGSWALYDNTRLGAAKRIQYLIDNGFPDVEDFRDIGDFWNPAIYADVEVKR